MKNENTLKNLGKKVIYGDLTKVDLLIDTKILVQAGIDYYKNNDQEYLNEQLNKNWFEVCTINHIFQYINQIKN
jgi:hypothetical protein